MDAENVAHALEEEEEVGILIVGAGMSGIAVADRLNRFGITDFLIVEGQDKVGGRLKSHIIHAEDTEHDTAVELGANWIHGVTGNYLTELAKQHNVTGNLSDFKDLIVYDEEELLYDSQLLDDSSYSHVLYNELNTRLNTVHQDCINLAKDYVYAREPDISIGAVLRLFGWEEESSLAQALTWRKYDYDFADAPETCSLKNSLPTSTYRHFTKSDLMVNGGNWDRMLHGMINKDGGFATKFRLNELVVSIVVEDQSGTASFFHNWRKIFGNDMEMKDKLVRVTSLEKRTGLKKVYRANRVVVTSSVGVLQANTPELFPNPPLPQWKRKEIAKFRMGVYMKIFLVFGEQFWPDHEFLMYTDKRRGYYPEWTNMNHHKRLGKKHPLKVWMVTVTGSEAKRIELLSNKEIQTEVVTVYRRFLKNASLPLPMQIVVPRWGSDPLFRGSHSLWPPSTTWKDHQKLCKPVFDSGIHPDLVWFAGEHCQDNYQGNVHGALLSGNETATLLMNCLAKRSKCPSNVTSLIWLSCLAVGSLAMIIVVTWFTWVHGFTLAGRIRKLVLDSTPRYTGFFSMHSPNSVETIVEKYIKSFKALYRKCSSPVGMQYIIGAFLFTTDSMIMLTFEMSIDKTKGYYGEEKRSFAYNPASVLLVMWLVTPISYAVKQRAENREQSNGGCLLSSLLPTKLELTLRDLWKIILAGTAMGLGDLFELMAIHSAGPAFVSVATTMEIIFCLFWSQLLMKVCVLETAYYLSLMVILSNIVLLAILEEFPRTWTDFVEINNGRGNGAAFTTGGGVLYGFALSLLAVNLRGFAHSMVEFVLTALPDEDTGDVTQDAPQGQLGPRDQFRLSRHHQSQSQLIRPSLRRPSLSCRSLSIHLERDDDSNRTRTWQAITLLTAAEGLAIFPYIPYGYARGQPMGKHFFNGWDYRTVIFLLSLILGQVAGSLGAWKLRAMTIEVLGLLVSVAVFVISMLLFPPLPGSQSEDARGYFRFEASLVLVIIFLCTLTMIRGQIYGEENGEEEVVPENVQPQAQQRFCDNSSRHVIEEESNVNLEGRASLSSSSCVNNDGFQDNPSRKTMEEESNGNFEGRGDVENTNEERNGNFEGTAS